MTSISVSDAELCVSHAVRREPWQVRDVYFTHCTVPGNGSTDGLDASGVATAANFPDDLSDLACESVRAGQSSAAGREPNGVRAIDFVRRVDS